MFNGYYRKQVHAFFEKRYREKRKKRKDEYRRKEERGKKTIEKTMEPVTLDEGGWLVTAFTLNKGSPVFESHLSSEIFADRKK